MQTRKNNQLSKCHIFCNCLFSELLPNDPDFVVGHNPDMACLLLRPNMSTESSRLTVRIFTRDNRTYSFDSTPVRVETANEVNKVRRTSRGYVEIVNSTMTRLTLPKLDLSFNRALIKCCARPEGSNRSECDEQILAVGCKCSLPIR